MEELSAHGSQVDAKKGFGGKFGVQKDRVDKVSDRHLGIEVQAFLLDQLFLFI